MSKTTKESLTAQDLALYLEQPCKVIRELTPAFKGKIVPLTAIVLVNVELGNMEVVPVLRPLPSMTEEEAREWYRLRHGQDFDPYRPQGMDDDEWQEFRQTACLTQEWKSRDESYNEARWHEIGRPETWRWLLSKGFDLFGWIPAGLAIDKTKIEINETK